MNYHTIVKQLKDIYPATEANALARCAICHVTQLPFALAIVHELTNDEEAKLHEISSRLLHNEPIQYIVGQTNFCNLTIKCTPSALIPRPETEMLVNEALNAIQTIANPRVLDVGTGTGAIAASIAQARPDAAVMATDISQAALDLARQNFDLNNVAVTTVLDDILNTRLEHTYDLIVSNPPYITENEKNEMHRNVLDFEPHTALFVDSNAPMVFNAALARFAASHLVEGGTIIVEINQYLSEQAAREYENASLKNVRIIDDIYNNPRFIIAQK